MATQERVEAFLTERRNVIVVGVRADGRPHATPNWFAWDGAHFYVSTTRTRAKYRIFRRDPRAQLVVDDSSGFRCVLVDGHVEIREQLEQELAHFRAIREKYGMAVPSDAEQLAALRAEERVLLVITPAAPLGRWTTWGLD
jgi:PPOX class probable F420-dependent enzyme